MNVSQCKCSLYVLRKKASIFERFNRTLKSKMWKQFSLRGNHKWIDILPNLVFEYNNTKHRSIGMKPNKVTAEKENYLVHRLNKCKRPLEKPKFKVGDQVRISKYKPVFEKGYVANWTTEIFTIVKVQNTKPFTYKLEDYQKQRISGGFYGFKLQKSKVTDIYLVEKVIRRSGNRALVKWLRFDESHNQWINAADL